MALELDLRMEGGGGLRTRREHARAIDDFRVPAIDWTRTSDRVLTTEWIDGTPIRDPAALEAAGHDPKRIALVVLRSFLTQALRDGFFHADMHPGNLFVDAEGRLVAVDFGIMGRLDPPMRRFMAETLRRLPRARLSSASRRCITTRALCRRTIRVETFAQALRADRRADLRAHRRAMSRWRKLLQQLFDTTRRFDMQAAAAARAAAEDDGGGGGRRARARSRFRHLGSRRARSSRNG